MNKRALLFFISLLISILIVPVCALPSVGLSEGDWVEYDISYTGSPPDSYPASARLEVQSIQGTTFTVSIRTELLNGTQSTKSYTFNLESGAPDLIIIPSNLDVGDEVSHEDVGSFLIEGISEYDYKGETRELVYAYVSQVDISWDRATGVLIEAEQSEDSWTQTFLAVNTNIVQSQFLGLDSTLLYGIIIGVIIVLVVVIVVILKRKK
jgi:hypothetical protein